MTDSMMNLSEVQQLSKNDSNSLEMSESKEEGTTLMEKKSPYPKSVFFIIGNEFCERFCYFGMRAILVLYFMDHLSWSNSAATGVYHAFIVCCFFTPILGAILADGYIGRYRTILYLSIVYTIGSALMSFTSFPPPFWLGPIIGLVLIAVGTGGIKPCVSAFGGDQFKKDQERERSSFFSAFYFAINLGSFFSIVLTPIIKDGVLCFDRKCFPLAFGVPAILMIISTGLFVLGKKWYILNPPPGSIITNFFKCIGSALKNKFKSHSSHKQHWLDHAGPEYQTSFLDDVKRVFKVLSLYIPVPVFWALFDQQGSRWTIQAAQLDRTFGNDWHMLPEQIQAVNPILILIFIPLFDMGVYPLLDKLNIPNKPLQRMVVGMLFASLSFIGSGILQLKIDSELSHLENNNSFVTLLNEAPCQLKVSGSLPEVTLQYGELSGHMSLPSTSYNFLVTSNSCVLDIEPFYQFTFVHPQSYLVVFSVGGFRALPLSGSATDNDTLTTGEKLVPVLRANSFSYDLNKEPTGECYLRVILLGPSSINLTSARIIGMTSPRQYNYEMHAYTQNDYIQLSTGRYVVTFEGYKDIQILLRSGGTYTLVLNLNQSDMTHHLIEDVEANKVSVWLQLPQYIIITLGEVVFAVTGLGFAYSQAPPSMKSVVQASWFLTTGFGNIIDVVIASSSVIPNQAAEFFFFAVLMFITTIIFAIIASYYQYYDDDVPYEDLDDKNLPQVDSNVIKLSEGSKPSEKSKPSTSLGNKVHSSQKFDWRKDEMENANITLGR